MASTKAVSISQLNDSLTALKDSLAAAVDVGSDRADVPVESLSDVVNLLVPVLLRDLNALRFEVGDPPLRLGQESPSLDL